MASGNSCKNVSFWPINQVWSTRPPPPRVPILFQPNGKWPTQTPANIYARSDGWIKIYVLFDPLLNSGQPYLLVTE
jgi:hypothetical protein